MEAPWGFALTS